MLVTTMNAVRAKLSALRVAAAATHPLASGAVKRFQHAEAAEATTDALQEFRETVRDFAQRAIAPHASEIDRQNNFPSSTNLWKDIGDFGLHGRPSGSSAVQSLTCLLSQQHYMHVVCRLDSTCGLWWTRCWLSASLRCHGGKTTLSWQCNTHANCVSIADCQSFDLQKRFCKACMSCCRKLAELLVLLV